MRMESCSWSMWPLFLLSIQRMSKSFFSDSVGHRRPKGWCKNWRCFHGTETVLLEGCLSDGTVIIANLHLETYFFLLVPVKITPWKVCLLRIWGAIGNLRTMLSFIFPGLESQSSNFVRTEYRLSLSSRWSKQRASFLLNVLNVLYCQAVKNT